MHKLAEFRYCLIRKKSHINQIEADRKIVEIRIQILKYLIQ